MAEDIDSDMQKPTEERNGEPFPISPGGKGDDTNRNEAMREAIQKLNEPKPGNIPSSNWPGRNWLAGKKKERENNRERRKRNNIRRHRPDHCPKGLALSPFLPPKNIRPKGV